MIPKVIHYCWFGRGQKSPLMKKCINSWKRILPEYEVTEWNEDNFNINEVLWTKQAYEHRKFAFVSDYVRLYALYNTGGIYMDTDVEVLKKLDRFLEHEAFSGFECIDTVPTGIIASERNQKVIGEWLAYYNDRRYIINGNPEMNPNVRFMTDILLGKGLILNNEFQIIDGMALYPQTFFCPLFPNKKQNVKSKNTYTIHHFTSTWRTDSGRRALKISKRHSAWWYKLYEQLIILPQKASRLILGEKLYTKIKFKIKKH